MSLTAPHPLDAASRRRAPSAASKGSTRSAGTGAGNSTEGSIASPREPGGYFDTQRPSSKEERRTVERQRTSSRAAGVEPELDALLGGRSGGTGMGMGMGPARARLPAVLRGVAAEGLDLLGVRFDTMDDEQMSGFFKANSTAASRQPSSSRENRAESSTSALDISRGPSTPLLDDPDPDKPLDSPNTPRPRPFPIARKSTARTTTGTGTGGSDSPLFPPSPPGGSRSETARNVDAVADSGARDGHPADEREALRVVSRLARELMDAVITLEEENEGLRQQLAAGTEGSTADRRRSSAQTPRRSIDMDRATRRISEPGRSGVALRLEADEDDAISMHDSLAEALSTSLPSEADTLSLRSTRSRHASASIPAPASSRSLGRPASSSISSRTGTGTGQSSRPGRARRTSSLWGRAAQDDESQPGSAASGVEAEAAGLVPSPAEPKRTNRSSWTSNLWSWTTGSGGSPAVKQGTSTAFDKVAETPEGPSDMTATIRPNSLARFAPSLLSKASPVVQPSRVAVGVEDPAMDGTASYRRDQPSPAFRAIFLATRILTPDPASILLPGLATSSLVSYLAHTLISNAQEEGISLREFRSRRASVAGAAKGPAEQEGTAASYGETITASFNIALATVKLTPRSGKGRQGDARKSLLRTLSHKPGLESPGPDSPSRQPVTPPSRYGISQSDDSTPSSPTRSMPAVELGSIGGLGLKPPSLLPRRATLEDFLHLDEGAKVASQFDGKGVKAYTDRYGFVYDVKHAQALVEAQSNLPSATAAPQPADDWADQKRERYTSPARSSRSGLTQDSAESNQSQVVTPESTMQRQHSDPQVRIVPPDSPLSPRSTGFKELVIESLPGPRRPRAATTSGLGQPLPVKPAVAEQSLTVSSIGAVDLAPTITAGPLRSVSGTIRPVKYPRSSLDSVRKPVSALLSQLTDTYEREEQERTKNWDAYLQQRRSSSGASIRSLNESSQWQGDLLGLSRMGSGKTGLEARKELNRLVRNQGLPMALRAQIWAEFAGAKDAFEPGVYEDLLAAHKGGDPPIIAEIDKDVSRTFASNVYFGGDGIGCQKLRRLLVAYSWRDPEIGYCQGMNLLAATLLLAYEEEERAFYTFVCTIQAMLPSHFYTASLLGSRAEQAVLAGYVDELCPDIANKLDDLGVDLSALTFGWLLSLFTNCLPVETLFRVWDVFYAEGNDVIIRTAIAILKLGEPALLAAESVPELFETVNSLEKRLHRADKLIQLQHHLGRSIKKADLEVRRKRILQNMKG